MDEAIPRGTEAVSISSGFVNEVFEGNRIDLRGGRRSDSFVLPGNHFGTRVVNNHLLGGGLAFRMTAYPTEHPIIWGWSHVPFLGGVVEGNILEDCEQGGIVGVDHGQYIKTNKGRTYMSMRLRKNVVRWSEPFLTRMARADKKEPLAGLTIGYRPSHDPGELIVSAEGNSLDAPSGYRDAPALLIHAALYNSQRVVNRKFKMTSDTLGRSRPSHVEHEKQWAATMSSYSSRQRLTIPEPSHSSERRAIVRSRILTTSSGIASAHRCGLDKASPYRNPSSPG